MDPLVHILRNAIGHGLESPAERLAGKAGAGALVLEASRERSSVVIEFRMMDGGSLGRASAARARAAGLRRTSRE